MNRQKMVAGNWKMNTTLQEGMELARGVMIKVQTHRLSAKVILAPPFTHLAAISGLTRNSAIGTAAQNCASESKGAFTGEVSVSMIRSTGAEYVIIGHSERRSYYHEDDGLLFKKTSLALEGGLLPIFCCGEVLAERQAEQHKKVVRKQLENTIFRFSQEEFSKIVIAYEPVWAIGTGVNATPEQAQEMHRYIRDLISEKYGDKVADQTTILYGGSCKPSNARELFVNPDVDGGLIGGASLTVEDFMGIVSAAT